MAVVEERLKCMSVNKEMHVPRETRVFLLLAAVV